MNAETAAKLRAPFPAEAIGQLPRITCRACSDSSTRVCNQHAKSRCNTCENYITSAHIHLDYVGHADVTDRLVEVDPEWTWEPVAWTPEGLPRMDEHGGLWIKLSVAGVTRLGYGDAQGKKGPNAVKEVIGDALRNAAMRFGVALNLWMKGDRETAQRYTEGEPEERRTTPAAPAPGKSEPDQIRDAIREFAAGRQAQGWRLDTIAAEYRQQYPGRDIRSETDVEALNLFFQQLQVDAQAEDDLAKAKGGEAA